MIYNYKMHKLLNFSSSQLNKNFIFSNVLKTINEITSKTYICVFYVFCNILVRIL